MERRRASLLPSRECCVPRADASGPKGIIMRHVVEIENIEDLRRREGIEDVELRNAIRGLAVGDVVKLTFLTGATPNAGETLRVRITRIEDGEFRGKLGSTPAAI